MEFESKFAFIIIPCDPKIAKNKGMVHGLYILNCGMTDEFLMWKYSVVSPGCCTIYIYDLVAVYGNR